MFLHNGTNRGLVINSEIKIIFKWTQEMNLPWFFRSFTARWVTNLHIVKRWYIDWYTDPRCNTLCIVIFSHLTCNTMIWQWTPVRNDNRLKDEILELHISIENYSYNLRMHILCRIILNKRKIINVSKSIIQFWVLRYQNLCDCRFIYMNEGFWYQYRFLRFEIQKKWITW